MTEEKQNQPQINGDERRYKQKEVTETIIGVFYEVYERKKISVHLLKSAANNS